MNGMEDTRIYEGQRIKVRKPKETTGTLPRMRGERGIVEAEGLNPFVRSFYLPDLIESVTLKSQAQGVSREAQLYGVVLENYHQSGILYHMIGVNGAKFEHYNQANSFWEQVQALKPDLIIISLGTNETVGRYFAGDNFFADLDGFVYHLETHIPHGSILLTAPPDAYRAK